MLRKTSVLQGTLDLLILRALSSGPLHGLGVAQRVRQMTKETFQIGPGSLFPALHRMEDTGWLVSEWGESENNRQAKYYKLTKQGVRQLDVETQEWERISLAMAAALKSV